MSSNRTPDPGKKCHICRQYKWCYEYDGGKHICGSCAMDQLEENLQLIRAMRYDCVFCGKDLTPNDGKIRVWLSNNDNPDYSCCSPKCVAEYRKRMGFEEEGGRMNPYMRIEPGEFIREELETRGWGYYNASKMLDLPEETIIQLVNSEIRITDDIARSFSRVFGQSKEYWLKLGGTDL